MFKDPQIWFNLKKLNSRFYLKHNPRLQVRKQTAELLPGFTSTMPLLCATLLPWSFPSSSMGKGLVTSIFKLDDTSLSPPGKGLVTSIFKLLMTPGSPPVAAAPSPHRVAAPSSSPPHHHQGTDFPCTTTAAFSVQRSTAAIPTAARSHLVPIRSLPASKHQWPPTPCHPSLQSRCCILSLSSTNIDRHHRLLRPRQSRQTEWAL
jgi:hypothetical protein